MAKWKVVVACVVAGTTLPLLWAWYAFSARGDARHFASQITDVSWSRAANVAHVATLAGDVYEVSAVDMSIKRHRRFALRNAGPVAVSPGLGLLAVGQSDFAANGIVETRDMATDERLWRKALHNGMVCDLRYFGEPQCLVSCGHDGDSDWGAGGEIRVADAHSGETLALLAGLHSMPLRLAVRESAGSFAVQFYDGTVKGWNFRPGDEEPSCVPIADLQIEGARFLCESADDGRLWAVLEGQCFVFDWEQSTTTRLQLPTGVGLDAMTVRADGRGIVGVDSGHLIWFDIQGRALVKRRVESCWWARCVVGTAEPDKVLAYGYSRAGLFVCPDSLADRTPQ